MSQNTFEVACDRLSQVVDAVQFERLRWARTEAPMLARLVELSHGALESRGDFELTEEGSTAELKRYVIKVHSNRIVALSISLDHGRAVIDVHGIDRSKFRVEPGAPAVIEFQQADPGWMASALQQLFGRISQSAH